MTTNKFKYIAFLFLVTFVITLISCNEGCNSQLTPNRQVKLSFIKSTINNTFPDTTIPGVFVFTGDSIFFYRNASASKVSIELNQTSDTTMVFLKTDSINNNLTDTLVFTYQRELILMSSECGFNTSFKSFKLSGYTNNKIDSVIMISTDINADVPENYRFIIKKNGVR